MSLTERLTKYSFSYLLMCVCVCQSIPKRYFMKKRIKMKEIFIHYLSLALYRLEARTIDEKMARIEETRKILRFCDDTAI